MKKGEMVGGELGDKRDEEGEEVIVLEEGMWRRWQNVERRQ